VVGRDTRGDPIASGGDRIRLAIAITELEVGGAERAAANLATGIKDRGFDVAMYSLAPAPRNKTLVDRLHAADVPVHFVGARHSVQILSAAGRLARMLAEFRPHVLQTFLFHANVVGALAARRAEVPVLVGGIRVAEPKRWHLWLQRRLMGRFDRFVCVSESVAGHARERGAIDSDKLIVIPNGIDAAAYAVDRSTDLTALGVPEGKRAIVCIGRLNRQKGIDVLIDAAPSFLARLPEHELLVVGEGPWRGRLEARAAASGVAKRIHFCGYRNDVPEILAACELLVLPSRWEGMPNVILEAMAGGLPVVASDVEGIAEVLGPLAPEQTVPPLDTGALASHVAGILEHRGAAERLGAANRARVEKHFSLSAVVDAYERLYRSLVSRDSTPAE